MVPAMSQMTIEDAMRIAIGHHQEGHWAEAEGIYRQILAQVPSHADALHLLGALACQTGRPDRAIDLIGRAIAIDPAVAAYHGNLGESYRRAGRREEAIASLRRAIELRPDFADAHGNLGLALMDQGRTEEAIAAFRRAIELRPESASADDHVNLGRALTKVGRSEEAIAAFDRAISLRPEHAQSHCFLGHALKRAGRLEEARAAYLQATRVRPDYAEAYYFQGAVLKDQGRLDDAIAAYRRAIALRPELAEAHSNLGNALWNAKRFGEAIDAYRSAVALRPEDAEAHNGLGGALYSNHRLDEAIDTFRRAASLRPDHAEAHNNLGIALKAAGRPEEAVGVYLRSIEFRPDHAETHNNLGLALSELGRLDEAIAAFGQAISLRPDYAEAHINLGVVFKDQGRLDEALAEYRTAVALKPDMMVAASNLLCNLHYHPDYDAQAILAEHRAWTRSSADSLAAELGPPVNARAPDRRLRIGFVSPDFKNHPVGLSLVPLLSHLDRRQFEVVCYSDVKTADEATPLLRALTDEWRDIAGLGDSLVAQRIRDDRIDILVDLAVHTAGNRMLVFARRPAPVQVTMLGMPATTGLAAMDYRVTDPYLDPPGGGDENYAENLIRLPHSFWWYHPLDGTPQVQPLPALEKGYVTFGCLNNFVKVSRPALKLWLRILQAAVPGSRLVICARTGSHLDAVRALFAEGGVAQDRVEFTPWTSQARYFARYRDLDLSLDPFPYNGHTSALDSLWMGVPVITLAGRTAVGRGGVSILSNVGLPELIADTPDRYVEIAVDWASDLARLSALRAGLRERLRGSPLMDGAGYAADVGAALRRAWQAWCQR
jgi:predicted O-linked N-acetylglucosamine transferase (SPINDLY family)